MIEGIKDFEHFDVGDLDGLQAELDKVVSVGIGDVELDQQFKDEIVDDGYTLDIVNHALNYDNGQSHYSNINFVAGTGLTPYKKAQQCFMEIDVRYGNFKESFRKLKRWAIKAQMTVEDMKLTDDKLEKAMLKQDYDDLMYDMIYAKRKLIQCKREITDFISIVKTIYPNPEDIKKSIKHDPVEERKYWMARMAKQAAMDIISYGRIGSGNLDSILLMDERDQLDCLKGALDFAGKLNGTIDQANKELEIKYKGADLTLENLRMPALLDQIDDNEQKNIQHTPESKTDGISI
jgi:hypothetical protein